MADARHRSTRGAPETPRRRPGDADDLSAPEPLAIRRPPQAEPQAPSATESRPSPTERIGREAILDVDLSDA
jgi:hypothetical protein